MLVVEPTDWDDLKVVEGQDYVTLYTCTPYGVNSHRLLVRGTGWRPRRQSRSSLPSLWRDCGPLLRGDGAGRGGCPADLGHPRLETAWKTGGA